jgi:hypothetical protein
MAGSLALTPIAFAGANVWAPNSDDTVSKFQVGQDPWVRTSRRSWAHQRQKKAHFKAKAEINPTFGSNKYSAMIISAPHLRVSQ